jgi:A/G-specific adenine glycosylase
MNFSGTLLSWYHENKRDLPWRKTTDPYLVWLSEIILQQTRINQGLPYFNKFIKTFPDIKRLADAEESNVLKVWQGLGYYVRARNLHQTAREIIVKYHGIFPADYAAIRSLKGIGDYTAAAIASISFNLPYPVVDGNVLRFLSRFSGVLQSIDKQQVKIEIRNLASRYITHDSPGDFNQAMMEIGATICKPSNPACSGCPFSSKCFAFLNNRVDEIPVRTLKTAKKNRYLNYFVVTINHEGEERILLNKREAQGIWQNLFDFPCIETNMDIKPEEIIKTRNFPVVLLSGKFQYQGVSETYSHLLTHQRLTIRFFRFRLAKYESSPHLAVPILKINDFPFPRVIARYLVNSHFI